MMRLNGKVILLTGSRGGLGSVVIPILSGAGATLIVVDRVLSQDIIDRRGGFRADVTNESEVTRVVADTVRQAGRIDGLINLVGAFVPGSAVDTDVAKWQTMLSLNVTSAFLLSRAVIPHMTARRSGRLIHIAARAALEPFPGAAAYLVAKAALISLIRVLALELGGAGVTVNGILPGTIDTPANRESMPQADRSTWVKPESIAQVLVWLMSDDTAAINGALIPVGPS
ncbi:MAG TPA: SDR family oxidoreductase [Nitrospiraceae bacterium]|jgi:NAD(P)-dependent dehydrogenase (short-subunit alcohol dehydrogenase family)|nr:SDR family oxidoreductase [Nitrospiraceae bacterium]